jgi:hypothetical protein
MDSVLLYAVYAAGYLVAVWPGAWIVGRVIKPFTGSGLPDGFPNAGRRIGQLERFIIFSALLVGSYALVGIILTLKAIYRFSDIEGDTRTKMKISEYFIIGTFTSLAWTLVIFGLCRLGLSWFLGAS